MSQSSASVMASGRTSSLYISDGEGVRCLRLNIGADAPEALQLAAMRYFDDDMVAVGGMITELPAFIEQARRIDGRFQCQADALNFILEARDRRRRLEMLGGLSDSDIQASVAATLYPYQIEGVRFAFGAGRAVIADEPGLGKAVQAIATAELLRRRNMLSTVLIVCPTSLKHQWKKDIERYAGAEAVVVDGAHTERRGLYGADAVYKVVSYHTLANDIRSLGHYSTDMLVLDEAHRLKEWNAQIERALHSVESDYSVVLSGSADCYAGGAESVLSRSLRAVQGQLPQVVEKVLYVSMTREQAAVYQESAEVVRDLSAKWRRHGFMTEKNRRRLMRMLGRVRMACDSTGLIDRATRHGSKGGEVLQLVTAMTRSSQHGRIVIASQWDRMLRQIGEELERAGIGFVSVHGGLPLYRRKAMTGNRDVRVVLCSDAAAVGLQIPDVGLLINVDIPCDASVLDDRLSSVWRGDDKGQIRVINMVSAGTIEERLIESAEYRRGGFAAVGDGNEERLTLDDLTLTLIADALSELIPEVPKEPTTDELRGRVAALLKELSAILDSPAARAALIDSIRN